MHQSSAYSVSVCNTSVITIFKFTHTEESIWRVHIEPVFSAFNISSENLFCQYRRIYNACCFIFIFEYYFCILVIVVSYKPCEEPSDSTIFRLDFTLVANLLRNNKVFCLIGFNRNFYYIYSCRIFYTGLCGCFFFNCIILLNLRQITSVSCLQVFLRILDSIEAKRCFCHKACPVERGFIM